MAGDGVVAFFENFGDLRWENVQQKSIRIRPFFDGCPYKIAGKDEYNERRRAQVHREKKSLDVFADIKSMLGEVAVRPHGDRQDDQIKQEPRS